MSNVVKFNPTAVRGGRAPRKVIDLFAGSGGIRCAFEATGRYRTVFSSEIDKFARQTYAANFGDVPAGDITKIDAAAIPAADVVVGGPPCQAFSMAGKRGGFGDPRGTLFYDYLRVIKAKRPLAFVMENVMGLLSHDGGRTFATMLHEFDRAGYDVSHAVLAAQAFGVPQTRERVFVVGLRDDLGLGSDFAFPFPRGTVAVPVGVGSVLERDVGPKHYVSPERMRGIERHKARHLAKGNKFGYAVLDLAKPAHTVTTRTTGLERNLIFDPAVPPGPLVNDRQLRRLTLRECARLQGYPETFVFPVSATQALKQIGNSVAVPVVTAIALRLAAALDLAARLAPQRKAA